MYGKGKSQDFLRCLGLQCHVSFEDTDQQTNNLECHKNFPNPENKSICSGVPACKWTHGWLPYSSPCN